MVYCYACKCGNKTEKTVPMSMFAKTIICVKCKRLMGIDPAAQQGHRPNTASNWPQESDAMGVHPDQAKEYGDYLREKGVPTEINSEGNPVLTSRHHRKLVCAATDTYDRNAGYGDQSRQTPLPEKTPRRRHGR
jgi:hypothetical protein